MADITKETVESLSPEQLEALWLAKREEVEQAKADASRWVNDYAERVNSYAENYESVKSDNSKLLEIYEQDQKLWELYLKKMFDGKSIDEFKASLEESKKIAPENIDELVNAALNKKEVASKLEKVRARIPEELREEFDTEWEALTEWKELNADNVNKFIKATVSVIQDEWDKLKDIAQIYGSKWGSSWKKVSASEAEIERRKNYALNL